MAVTLKGAGDALKFIRAFGSNEEFRQHLGAEPAGALKELLNIDVPHLDPPRRTHVIEVDGQPSRVAGKPQKFLPWFGPGCPIKLDLPGRSAGTTRTSIRRTCRLLFAERDVVSVDVGGGSARRHGD